MSQIDFKNLQKKYGANSTELATIMIKIHEAVEDELQSLRNRAHNLETATPHRGQMQITPDAILAFTAIDTYEKIVGVWTDSCLSQFVFHPDGMLIYTGLNTCFLFNGSSDFQVDKACEVSYALFKNGMLVPGTETPHTFTAAAEISNISITRICTLETGDVIEVYAKCSDATATATIKSLSITLWGKQ